VAPTPQTITTPQKQQANSYNNSEITNSSILDKVRSTNGPFFNGRFTFKLTKVRQENNQFLINYKLPINRGEIITTLSLSRLSSTLKVGIVTAKSRIYESNKCMIWKYYMWHTEFDTSVDINNVIRQTLGESLVFTMLNKATAYCSNCKKRIYNLQEKLWPPLIYFEDETSIHFACHPSNLQPIIARNPIIITHQTSILYC
jgi:hypothetical protein